MNASRDRIRKLILGGKTHSVVIGERTIAIRARQGRFQITIMKDGQKPNVWVYRKEAIAMDRFFEHCEYFRRGE